ncbi:MAG: hypothetical protein IIX87_01815, partial [Firmicutes bacterium]|nr:hypothetical protein [Bacillota bacterium]
DGQGQGKNGSPAFSLCFTNGIIQVFLIICYFSSSTSQAFYALSTSMIMVPYLLSAAYYLKISLKGEGFEEGRGGSLTMARIFGLIGTVYGFWMLYSGGLDYVLITTILYSPGILVYMRGRREKGLSPFASRGELILALVILALALLSIWMMITGSLSAL